MPLEDGMPKELKSYLKLASDIVQAKERMGLIIEAKSKVLQMHVTLGDPPETIEKARQELIDAFTAGIDQGIEMYQRLQALDKEKLGG